MKKELIALTAIAATGLATTVSANEVAEPNVDNAGGVRTAQTEPAFNITDAKNEPALVEKEAPKKVEVKTPTKEEVAELGATAKQTQEDADKAKEVLDQANENSDKAEKKVADLKQAKDDAQKTADKATPEVIKDAEKKVETAKAKVPTAEQGVSSAQTEQDDADRNVAIQGKTVGTKQAEVTQAENGVADAKTTVKNAEDALNGVGLADAKEKQDAAIKEEATSKQAQEDAQAALDEAKKLDGELADQITKAETTVKTATQDVERTENEAKTAKTNRDNALAIYNQAVSVLDALQDSSKKQTITLSPAFIQAVKDEMEFLRQIRSGVEMTEEERDKRTMELYDKIVNAQVEHKKLNKYVPSKADQADETRYDINNLPQAIKDELNYYVVDLINQMRHQLGLSDVVLSKTSLEFADKVAKEYLKANFSKAMKDDYRAKGGVGHYAKGVNKVAKEYGMPTTDKEEENKGEQYYENTVTTYVFHDFDDADGVYRKTLGEMKEQLYNDLIMLVSTKGDYAHTQGILQFDYAHETIYFGGVAQSKTDDFYTTHFLTAIRNEEVKDSKWDKTPIANPLSNEAIERKLSEARQALADAMTARDNTQATFEAKTKAESDAKLALTNAEANLTALKNGESPLANAQKAFDKAKERHDMAVVTLSNANALVNTLTATQSVKEEALKDAQAKLKDAEKVLKTAQEALKAEEGKMKELEAIATSKAQAVSLAKKALQDAQKEVKQAEKELADLNGAKARLKEAKAELEKAETELKDVYKAQNKAKLDYEVKSLAADQAQTAYETAKAKFEEAEAKRLAELADAKRKELEKAGYQPVPVLDEKGNIVDYTVDQVTVGTKDDKTYQAPAQATNAKAEPKKQLPNTGTKESGLLALLGASVGLLALAGKRKYR
ncbi:SEC10/PgrA surface exclusion domain-containing protein [Streptococcus sp. DTU_2020_1001019_1_SI_AUS_MUR_006]|uniref:SEC10/PgrA surface exclusion domain-containing protein n=1 Tax=Streptococcus sp. DTU_2020_1001019_1_SI_AUS_MUR_006 TaxID=3077584 RepID=UPI0028F024BD|nr:SEC10/PgrA surface exclusion domain-containing protein [Streptococcus sp. DTU_2020_1001019_1_SI_AUS_MUR_006]WNS72008.1 SEC10/PgrA surface exclusion domain-containing protein [Streptococcus sp. DTU_2020_1001019_1_SI_AUS_MUR_006]